MVNKAELEQKLKKLSGLSPEAQAKAVKTLFTSEELKFLQQQAMHSKQPGKCIFCAIVKGEIPAQIVYSDAHFLAFLDINPVNPGHLLIVPKQHYEVFPQIPDELNAAFMKLLKILSAAVFEATNAQGVNIVQNNGIAAGQAVPHVHFHIFPRFDNDGKEIKWKTEKVTDKQLENIQSRIVAAAQKLAADKAPKKEVDELKKAKTKIEKIKLKKRKP